MNETASLVIGVRSDQVPKAGKELDNLTEKAIKTERATDGLVATFKRLIGPLLGIVSAGAALRKLVDTTKTFQSLQAQLVTATGSAEDAGIAFQALTEFATQTPYALEDSVNAFIQLTNLGLTPSERALRSFGNTASAMGRNIGDFVNAVARAASGEFEPLKAFGILAKKEGDNLKVSFRGVTETIGNSTAEIEEYFTKLGENNFAGAMAEKMNTLEGAMSNFGDALDQAVFEISKMGIGNIITSGFRMATTEIENLTTMIRSGELNGYLDAIAMKFNGIAKAAQTSFEIIQSAFGKENIGFLGEVGAEVVAKFVDAMKYLPENIFSLVQVAGAGLGLLVNYAEAISGGLVGVFGSLWQAMSRGFDNVGREIKDQFYSIFYNVGKAIKEFQIATAETLNRFLPDSKKYGEEFFAPLRAEIADFEKKLGGVEFNFKAEQIMTLQTAFSEIKREVVGVGVSMKETNEGFLETLDGIIAANETAKASFDGVVDKAKEARVAYEQEQKILKALSDFFKEDKTARFSKATPKGGLSDERMKEFVRLKEFLLSEEKAYDESYKHRAALINDNILLSGEQRFALLAALDERAVIEEANAFSDKAARLESQYMAEQMFLQDALDKRLLSEAEFQAKSKDNWVGYTKAISTTVTGGTQIIAMKQLQMHSQVLSLAGDISSQLASLAGENTAMAKAMFVASKAIAIAQAIVNTEAAATRALAEGGFYAGIPMASVIRAMGYASVGIMAGQAVGEFQGKFAKGGMISAGRYGITQEEGFELTRGPAIVTSAAATRDAIKSSVKGSGDGSVVQISIVNQTGVEFDAEQQDRGDGGFDLILKRVRTAIASDIRDGDNAISRSLESSLGLRRANGAR